MKYRINEEKILEIHCDNKRKEISIADLLQSQLIANIFIQTDSRGFKA